ncbi:hypothetical protein QR680_006142 [Steinernema hermaphroditum]|uniref:Uncharacterized protein n=1 Tax=Steinernema hermaphroditum TaxID=289476 RepID=A0AA39LWX1_9BILA|nr:hypothetical protein QR680_006142 [Steinernema hermaphroditum]
MNAPTALAFEVGHTAVNATVILLSIFYVKSSLCRTYALNHAIVSSLISCFEMFLNFVEITGFLKDSFFGSKLKWTHFMKVVINQYTNCTYCVFSTLIVLMNYILYTYPMKYSHLMNKRKVLHVLIAGHGVVIFLVALVVPGAINEVVMKNSARVTEVNLFALLFFFQHIVLHIQLGVMTVLYVMAVYKIIKFTKKKKSRNARRSQLLSVLIYCTPPNIFLLINLPRDICVVATGLDLVADPLFISVCDVSRTVFHYISSMRFAVASLCILIAFREYRRAIVRLLKGQQIGPQSAVFTASTGMANGTKDPIPMSVLIPSSLALEVAHTAVNFIIIGLSIFRVKPNLCRTYALNHSILSAFFSTFMMIVDLSDVTGIGRSVFFAGEHSLSDKKMWVLFVSAFLIRYTANSYRVFATLMVLLTFVSYTYPFVYSKWMNDKRIIYIFLAGHGLVLFSISLWAPVTVSQMLIADSQQLGKSFLTSIFYGEKIFGFVMFGIMVVLYFLSIYKIIQFSKKQKSTSNQKRKSQLLSVLIYCTPPNIFLLIAMPRNLCILLGSFGVDLSAVAVACEITKQIHSPMTTIRFFVSSICALIAFNDYRKIVLSVLLRFKVSPTNNSVVTISSVHASPNASSRR